LVQIQYRPQRRIKPLTLSGEVVKENAKAKKFSSKKNESPSILCGGLFYFLYGVIDERESES
jgi:hypothetical protein